MHLPHSLLLLALASASLRLRQWDKLCDRRATRQELDGLYEVFKDEMQDRSGNLYEAMGNRLQLDGLACH